MRLHVHNSLYLGEYDVAVQVLYRGRLTRPKLLTSLIEDIQRFGVRGHGGSNSKNDSARLSFDPNDEVDLAILSLETERHLRRIHLARKTARRRLPELGDGRMMISLNWWLDETVAKAIYAHSASEALDRGYPPPVVDAGVLAQLFSTLLVEHGLDFYTNKFSFGNFHEEVACFLSETWDNLWSEVREELDELRF